MLRFASHLGSRVLSRNRYPNVLGRILWSKGKRKIYLPQKIIYLLRKEGEKRGRCVPNSRVPYYDSFCMSHCPRDNQNYHSSPYLVYLRCLIYLLSLARL